MAEITNSLGALDVPENFAAFGERRDPSDWSGPPSPADKTAINNATPHGYTFHTNLEESSLVHMNGRIADGLTGRFMSADPFVSDPYNTQSFNRYSYVNNNPLTFTDPSGFGPCRSDRRARGCISIGFSFGFTFFGSSHSAGSSTPPPPVNYCIVAGPTGCSGGAPSKFKKLFDDIFGLPSSQLGNSGAGDGRFGTGACGWSSACLSFEDELRQPDLAVAAKRAIAIEAAKKALVALLLDEERREYGGLLYRNSDGSYGYTAELIRGSPASECGGGALGCVDAFEARDQVPEDARIVATFHAHPNNRVDVQYGRFSIPDITLAQGENILRLPIDSYVITINGSIDEYDSVRNEISTIWPKK